MSNSPGQLGVADSLPPAGSIGLSHGKIRQTHLPLLVETVLVTCAVIVAIRALAESPAFGALWLAAPAILVTAALGVTAIKKDRFVEIGLSTGRAKLALAVLCRTCVVIFPATFFGMWLLAHWGLTTPLRPALPETGQWLSWLFYQFMYVAVAEEVFFRGYLQSNILRLTTAAKWDRQLGQRVSIVLSAACFAAAHVIVQGQVVSALTFLPGLVMAWLFVRTRALLAPVLFHGIANVCYSIFAGLL